MKVKKSENNHIFIIKGSTIEVKHHQMYTASKNSECVMYCVHIVLFLYCFQRKTFLTTANTNLYLCRLKIYGSNSAEFVTIVLSV